MPRNARRGTGAAVTALPAGKESAMPRIIRVGAPFTKLAVRPPSRHARRAAFRLRLRVCRIRPIVFRTALDGVAVHFYVALAVFPAPVVDLLGREANVLAWQPFARIDDQKPDRPGLIVEDEVIERSDRTVGCQDFIAGDFVTTAQVNIGRVALLVDASFDFARDRGIDRLLRRNERLGRCTDPRIRQHRGSPQPVALPVVRVSVIVVVVDLVLTGNRLVGVDARTVPDLLLRQVDVDNFVAPVDPAHRSRGDQHDASAQPAAGGDDQVTDRPTLVVEIDILHLAQFAIARADTQARQFPDSMQHDHPFRPMERSSIETTMAASFPLRPSDKLQETVGALCRQSRFIAIAQAANRMTSKPTITAFVSTARFVMAMTHDEITIQMPSRMLMTSSHACGIDTAMAENTTIATPSIHAFHDAESSEPAKPSTHGDMNNHIPISRLSQSCQRFSFMTYLLLPSTRLDAPVGSGFPRQRPLATKTWQDLQREKRQRLRTRSTLRGASARCADASRTTSNSAAIATAMAPGCLALTATPSTP